MSGSAGFDSPWILAGFGIFIPLLILDLLRLKGVRRMVRYLARRGGGGGLVAGEFSRRLKAAGLCYYLFLACMITALAGPRWGSRITGSYRRGLDLVLAVDLSQSMAVRDVPPLPQTGTSPEGSPVSRLERGLALAAGTVERSLGEHNPALRVGVALGRGRGILALPLSSDTEGIFGLLESLGPSSLTGRGTNLESLIDAAAGAFQDSFPGRRGILLLSDGEALSGNLGAALDRARTAGITVSVLGLGSDTGGPVPLQGPGEGLLLDGEGRRVISFRRSGVLEEAAAQSGGIYLDGNRNDAASLLGDHLRAMASGSGPGAVRREPGRRWHIFVIAGLGFWGLSRLLGLRRKEGGGES